MKLKALLFVTVVVAALSLAVSPAAFAQNVYAAIHGTVTDTSGAVVPGATVTALNTSTDIATKQTTDSKGYYILPQLAIGGPYTITIDLTGFQTAKTVGILLQSNDNREINAVLKPGSVSQTVEVSATAAQVETSDTQVKSTISSTEIEDMPLLGQDASALQKLTPGTVESSDRFGNFSANGSQTQENNYLLDGADNNDAPLQNQGLVISPEALSEVTFVTSTQNPEYSRNSGAIVNETIKSGTNQFHGEGFEFYRDTFLNNGNYFSATRPPFHQNLYGGTFGGPILKNKLFFFLSYQGLRNATGTTTLTKVPTDDQLGRNGSGFADLTGDNNVANGGTNGTVGLTGNPLPFAITGPSGTTCAAGTPWNTCFPTGSAVDVPTSNFNSISANLINKYVPSPNYNGTYYNFNSADTEGSDQGVMKIDVNITNSDKLWAEGIFQSNPSFETLPFTGANLPGFPEVDTSHFKIFSASWTHTFNPSTLNELRAGYYRFNFGAVESAIVQPPSSLGFAITPQSSAAYFAPKIGVTGYFTLGFSNNGPQPRLDGNYDYSDNFTKIIGNHNLMLGVHLERFTVDNPFYANAAGNFSFGGSGQFTSGDPLLDFLVGIPSGYSQGSGALINARAWEYYGYAQDNWKVTDSLTLNYGTGYDIQTPFANLQYGGEAIICFVPGAQSKIFPTATTSMLYPGDPGCNNQGGATAKYGHFAPRVGFAYSPNSSWGWLTGPAGEHLFSLRGGFGLYFNRDSEEAQLQNLEDPPFGTSSPGATAAPGIGSPSFANPFQDVANRGANYSITNPFPYTFPSPGQTNIDFSQFTPYGLSTISPNYDVPYAYNIMLQVQRQIPGSQVLTIGYVGSLGHKLVRAYEANRITPTGHAAAVATCLALGETACLSSYAIYPSLLTPQDYTETSGNFGTVGQVYTDGSSNYHSLQVNLTKSPSHGLYYILSYTYSHALDNSSSFESSGFGESNNLVGANWVPGFTQLSYGNSEYDARHRFVAGYGYVVPLTEGMRNNYIVNELLGGWHLAGMTALQSGNPVSVGGLGLNASLYCNGSEFTFYACPDNLSTSTYNIPRRAPRTLYSTADGPANFWFDPSPFSPEPLGTFGNVKRGFFSGPGFNYTNMSLFKNFPIGRADSPRFIQLRLETYNVFNHANFAQPDGSLADGPSFGTITSVVQPVLTGGDPQPGRAVQLAGKIYF